MVLKKSNFNIATEDLPLSHTTLFKHVPLDEARELFESLRQSVFSKGDVIFNEGDKDHRMYLLERGRVKLVRHSRDNRIQLLSIHTHGEILGEIPVFDPAGGPRTASAIALTDNTSVLWVEHDVLFAWIGKHPMVAVSMLQVLAARLRANNEHISDLVFMDVPARLAKTILNLASRFGEPIREGLLVQHDLTQEELAQLVGSSRETVNKALMDFSNRGWIKRRGRSIIIFEPEMLIRRAER
ncbi:Crp/Fnr family transcriptional regulator [Gardnerella sp. KA00735]|uniref:Crp/Fnr family transcriptional regulator n=1 Tax=Gardnerella sp. KA00735 TaxID=1973156 RepID=UPI000C9F577E|nr:Crp/Fnr family transcriptional regulator [Gardnerella sp. KA00735]PNP88898.1 Crp/Fnr family transcriptional regulator [Gardnerella sp. KA00735]